MINISIALAELINLKSIAVHHKEHCNSSDCGVALIQLKWTANRLLQNVYAHEKELANKILEEMPSI